jgi:hypothetical protein
MELGTVYRILKALFSTDAAHCAQILLTINVAVRHAEKPDELCGARSYVALNP